MNEEKQSTNSFMYKLSGFIVDKRNLIFLIVIIGIIFSLFSSSWVKVENDLAAFLPDSSPSKEGLSIMEEQFTTYGTTQVMISSITFDEAEKVKEKIENINGVQSVEFDETIDHYNNVSALYLITFDYSEDDEKCVELLDKVKEELSAYDLYISTELGNTMQETIATEVNIIMVYVAIIVVVVLLFTSQTYAEVPVLIITFLAAMILNSGTNFLFGTISFVSNSVTSILQLALSLDYAVILCNRFKEENQTLPLREAAVTALSKAIPEIGASSLTTVGGLIAMMFMQFKIGPDMALCLIKAILYALVSVFLLMPGLLMLFGKWMKKTEHRNFVPKIPFVGKFAHKTRFVIPPVFVVVVIIAFIVSNACPYAYGYANLTTPKLNESQIAENMIKDNFTSTNMVALVVPTGDYEKEGQLLAELDTYKEVDYSMGLANVEAMDGYMLADKLTPRQFGELAGLDYEMAQLIYAAYATEQAEYGKIISSLTTYEVPLIDMFLFVSDQVDSGLVTLDDEQTEMLSSAQTQMKSAKAQLQGEDYSRMLIYLTLPESGDETYDFIDTIRSTAQRYYPDGDVYVVGNSTTEQDFKSSFGTDNLVVTIVSILIVLVVLLFTFKSVGLPILLIIVIQGAIWINFSVPTLRDHPIFFMSYLVVSAIQMGANIDYAIVIASRFNELKYDMPKKEAMIETMNFAFPTIITSGTILAVAGTLIGQMTSEAAIVGIGESIGRGTIISMLLVMFVLPQILLLGDKIVEKTSFSMPKAALLPEKQVSGKMQIDGRVKGYISGTVDGVIHGTVDGDINVNLVSGTVLEEEAESNEE